MYATTLKRWTLPDSYFGATWEHYYSAGFGRTRDSSLLEESNFAFARKTLEALNTESTDDQNLDRETGTVIVVRENHWACGWVEWIAIHESDEAALRAAEEMQRRYEQYPALDEDDWSAREYEAAQEYWAGCSIRERLDLIKGTDVSPFAARRDYIPEDDDGSIYERCRPE